METKGVKEVGEAVVTAMFCTLGCRLAILAVDLLRRKLMPEEKAEKDK